MIDRLATTRGDERLVAHLAADEPAENADIVTSLYLADTEGRHCRRLQLDDLSYDPSSGHTTDPAPALERPSETLEGQLIDVRGYAHSLHATRKGSSIPELRWHSHPPSSGGGDPEIVSLRHVIGNLESYEPARVLTARALATHDRDDAVSVCLLRAELHRIDASRIVLNRGLREAVLAAVNTRGLSMSEIAIRCGRVKRDSNGTESGETSWLGRRIGLLPEGGKSAPTPWVSSEVLALVARRGLSIAPRDVEVD
ncbi:MAG TPA: hypothetical protein VGW98_00145 [Solirubrobacteraceae bacterium]|nr:hypothetical protein [Solirubrobacteraceae bacterium]